MIYQVRKRTKLEDIVYSLHLYFSGLSLRNTSKALSKFVHRSHAIAIRDWILKYKPERLLFRKKVSEIVIDKTQIKVGSELIWIWVAIEPTKDKEILSITISKERKICL